MSGASIGRPFFPRVMMTKERAPNFAIFFCQQLDPDQDVNRRALEAGADKVYLVTCPVGACRYREGNIRAKKRVEFAQKLIQEIGLEPERFELVNASSPGPFSIDAMARELINKAGGLPSSPLNVKKPKEAAHNTP